ncbi:MAG: hypothetical protein ACFFB0_07680 [Promethearchaeota archaeon]
MGIKDLIELKKRENRLLLILVIWLIVGFTAVQFRTTRILGIVIFVPLLGLLIILLLVLVVFKKNLKELTFKSILKYCLIAIPLILIFAALVLFAVLFLIIISILSYIFITSIFTLHSCYKWGINQDEKLYKMPKLLNFLVRSTSFVGGLILSIIIMLLIANIGFKLNIIPENVINELGHIPWVMISLFFVLFLVSLLFLFVGKLNAWLGIFLIYVSVYASYLILKASFSLIKSEESILALPIQISLYFFDLLLLLVTMGSLIGKKAEIISKKMKFLKPEIIILWLIFSKTAYEFTYAFPDQDFSKMPITFSFIIFIPLFLFIGFYGIFNYFKLKKQRKEKKKAKKLKRNDIKDISINEEEKFEEKIQEKPSEKDIREERITCPSCLAINRKSAKYCSKCGSKIK